MRASSQVQNAVEGWSCTNKLQLNANKRKEPVINFKPVMQTFNPITVDCKVLSVIEHSEIFGVIISSNLQ